MIRAPHRGECVVRLRRRSRLFIAEGGGTGAWSDALLFAEEGKARLVAVEYLQRRCEAFESAQILDAQNRQVLGTISIELAQSSAAGVAEEARREERPEDGEGKRSIATILDEIATEALASGDNSILDLVAEASDLLGTS